MLVIYGLPNSQPVRSVVWLCLIKNLPFELRLTSQNRDAKSPEFLRSINPRGTVPAIEDDGFIVWLNGKEAVSVHPPRGAPAYNKWAPEQHESGAYDCWDWVTITCGRIGSALPPSTPTV